MSVGAWRSGGSARCERRRVLAGGGGRRGGYRSIRRTVRLLTSDERAVWQPLACNELLLPAAFCRAVGLMLVFALAIAAWASAVTYREGGA